MGIFDKLIGSIGSSAGRSCPDCGETLWADTGELDGRYECHNDACTGWRVYFDEGGALVDPPNRSKSSGRTCISCQQSLDDSELTLAWEDGDNADAYVTCRHCGAENLWP